MGLAICLLIIAFLQTMGMLATVVSDKYDGWDRLGYMLGYAFTITVVILAAIALL